MTKTPCSDWVRETARQALLQHEPAAAQEGPETLLVRDGCYCGRRFSGERFSVIHWCGADKLEVHDEAGVCVRTIPLAATPPAGRRRAA